MEMGRSRRWLKAAVLVVAGTIFGVTLGLASVSVIATQFMGYHILTVKSQSMSPALEKGDVAVIKPADMPNIKEGDIVYVSTVAGLPLVHRVAAVNRIISTLHDGATGKVLGQNTEFRFRTKGDANATFDADEIQAAQFHGELWFSIPTFGLLATGVNVQVLLFTVAGLIAITWIAWEVAHRIRRTRPTAVTVPHGADRSGEPNESGVIP